MAAPYSLSTLNGVTFNANQIALEFNPSSHGDATSQGTEFRDNQALGSTIYAAYIDSLGGNSITISSETDQYTGGHQGSALYYLPTFGTLTFGQTIATNEGNYSTLYVHGFEVGGGGLLVSGKANVGLVYNSHYKFEYSETPGSQGGLSYAVLGILSDNDLGAGPNSPVYQMANAGHYFVDYQNHSHYLYNGTSSAAAPDMNPAPPTFPFVFTRDGAPPCFAEGTHVSTRCGDIAVEALRVNDEVFVASGGTRPVIWIGSRRVRPDRHRQPDELHPVCLRRGALSDGAPARDLRLSPGHAVFVDGVFVPVGLLVNGATIVQEPVESVRYFHVELDAHDVISAEGLPCESYLEDDNRDTFANADEHTALHGRLDPVSWEGACAPVLRDRAGDAATLAQIQARLHARAEAMGWSRVDSPELAVWLGDAALDVVHATADRLWVRAPADAALRLSSRAARPVDVIPGHLDTRLLGVAVAEVRVDGRALDLASCAFDAGFLAVERHGDAAWRWTDGEAWLRLDGADDASVLVEIAMRAAMPAWVAPSPRLRLVQVG